MRNRLDLKQFRLEHGISQIQLATASGLQNSLLSKIENGWEPLNLGTLEKLSLGFTRLKVKADGIISPLKTEARKAQASNLNRLAFKI